MMKRLARSLAIILSGAWAGLAALLYFFQEHFVYYPTRAIDALPSDVGLAFEDVWLRTSDGVRLHAWYVPAEQPRATVLFFHGNAGNVSHRLGTLQIFRALGLSTLILDYRGYGRSGGRISEEGTYRDAAAAWRHLVAERRIAPEDIIVFGRSLGGALATWIAANEHPRGLILESTFSSIADLGADLYPYLPVRLLTRIHYPTLDRIALVRCPILIAHSPDDEIIPYAHGRRLHGAAPAAEFYPLIGGHNDGFVVSGGPYYERLRQFIAATASD